MPTHRLVYLPAAVTASGQLAAAGKGVVAAFLGTGPVARTRRALPLKFNETILAALSRERAAAARGPSSTLSSAVLIGRAVYACGWGPLDPARGWAAGTRTCEPSGQHNVYMRGRSDRFRRAVLRCARSMVGDDRRTCGLPSRKRVCRNDPHHHTSAAARSERALSGSGLAPRASGERDHGVGTPFALVYWRW